MTSSGYIKKLTEKVMSSDNKLSPHIDPCKGTKGHDQLIPTEESGSEVKFFLTTKSLIYFFIDSAYIFLNASKIF